MIMYSNERPNKLLDPRCFVLSLWARIMAKQLEAKKSVRASMESQGAFLSLQAPSIPQLLVESSDHIGMMMMMMMMMMMVGGVEE